MYTAHTQQAEQGTRNTWAHLSKISPLPLVLACSEIMGNSINLCACTTSTDEGLLFEEYDIGPPSRLSVVPSGDNYRQHAEEVPYLFSTESELETTPLSLEDDSNLQAAARMKLQIDVDESVVENEL